MSEKKVIQAIASIPDVKDREAVLKNLKPQQIQSMTKHLRRLVLQKPGYKLSPKNAQQLGEELKPFKKQINKIIDGPLPPARPNQRGGFLISLLSAIIPVIAGAILNKLTK